MATETSAEYALIGLMGSSPATTAFFSDGPPEWFVGLAYEIVLGRTPGEREIQWHLPHATTWAGRLGVVSALASSEEFLARTGN